MAVPSQHPTLSFGNDFMTSVLRHLAHASRCAPLLLGLAAPACLAAPVTVDFGGGDGPLPYGENGFVVQGGGAQGWAGVTDAVLQDTTLAAGESVRIARQGGGTFRLLSFDLYRHDNLHATFDLLGFIDGLQVVDFGSYALGGGEYFQTLMSSSNALVDELRLVGTGGRGPNVVWDNFVFDVARQPVPEPASLPLALAGAAALAIFGRRHRVGSGRACPLPSRPC